MLPGRPDELVFRVDHLASSLKHLHLPAQRQDIPLLEIALHVTAPLEPGAGDIVGVIFDHQNKPGARSRHKSRLPNLADQGYLLADRSPINGQDPGPVQVAPGEIKK